MVEREKIQQKIAFLEANLEKLEILRSFSLEELQQDFMKLESAKHLLQVSIEAMLDIANHLIARCRLTAPSSAVQAFVTLAENRIITQATMEKCRLMARFRNRIVHIYFDVDISEIHQILQNELPDFRGFISDILSYLELNKK